MARKVLINLATGLEEPERVTVAFLVGGAAVQRGEPAAMWLTKEAVRLALPATPRVSRVMGAHRCRGCLSSSRTGRCVAGLPDLFQRPQARREGDGRQRALGRRHSNV